MPPTNITGSLYEKLTARAIDKRRQALGAGIAAYQARFGVQPIRPWWEGQQLDPVQVAEARNKLVAALAKLDEDVAKADTEVRGIEGKIAEAQKAHLDGILKYVTQLLDKQIQETGDVAAARVAAQANLAGTAGDLVKSTGYAAPPSEKGQSIVNDILNRYPELRDGGIFALSTTGQETMLSELTASVEAAGMRPEEKARVLMALDREMAKAGIDVANMGFVAALSQPSALDTEAAIRGSTSPTSAQGLKTADAITAAHQTFNEPLITAKQAIILAETSRDRLLRSAAAVDRGGMRDLGTKYANFVLRLAGVLDPGRPLTSQEYAQRMDAAIRELDPSMAAKVAPGRVPGKEDVEAAAARAGLLTPKALEQRRELILKAWDDLDHPDVLDPEESRVQIMGSPEFRAWMDKNGISDPDYAFRLAQRMAQRQRRGILAEDAANAGSAAPSRLALLGSSIPQPKAAESSTPAAEGSGGSPMSDTERLRANRQNRAASEAGGQTAVSAGQPPAPGAGGEVGVAPRVSGGLSDEEAVKAEIAGLAAANRERLARWLPRGA